MERNHFSNASKKFNFDKITVNVMQMYYKTKWFCFFKWNEKQWSSVALGAMASFFPSQVSD